MMAIPNLANLYAEKMYIHAFGHACYHKMTSNDVQPGVVGYFNIDGKWITIVKLADLQPSASTPADEVTLKFSKLDHDFKPAPDLSMVWGAMISEGTKKVVVDVNGSV